MVEKLHSRMVVLISPKQESFLSFAAEQLPCASSRCRHAVAAVGPYVFTYGGLRGSALLDDFLLADDSSGSELSICDPRSGPW